jgi:predicted RNA-binding protein with PUA-like domain
MPDKKYWLIKSEPDVFSIDDLKKASKTCWDGVRNYQARNFMRDTMAIGDLVLFYHSNAEPPGVAGIAQVCSKAYPDHTAWDASDHHYDPKTDKNNPTWMMVDVKFVEKFKHFVSLDDLRAEPKLADMLVLKRGQRLSVQPVEKSDFETVVKLGKSGK